MNYLEDYQKILACQSFDVCIHQMRIVMTMLMVIHPSLMDKLYCMYQYCAKLGAFLRRISVIVSLLFPGGIQVFCDAETCDYYNAYYTYDNFTR